MYTYKNTRRHVLRNRGALVPGGRHEHSAMAAAQPPPEPLLLTGTDFETGGCTTAQEQVLYLHQSGLVHLDYRMAGRLHSA